MPEQNITTKYKVDVSEFKKGISEANQQIKLANAKFKEASAGMDDWGKSTDGLKAKIQQLGSNLGAENKKLESYQAQLAKVQQASKENGARADELKKKLIDLANQGVSETSEEYKKYQKALNDTEREQMANDRAADKLKITITNQQAAVSKTESELNSYKNKLSETESETGKLTSKIENQQAELNKAKTKYQDLIISQGKGSTEAQKLAGEIQKLSSDLQENKNKLSQASDAADDLDGSLGNIDTETPSTGFTTMKGALANLIADGFRKAIDVTKEFIKSGIEFNASIEQYQTSFEVMTGSAKKAAAITEQLKSIATSTPFELPQLADTTQLLMNYGFTADDAMEKMKMLGDISQGSAEKMNRIATAYGQMSSAGKVSLEDVKQMIEAGFNPLQEISNSTGETMASLYDRISKGTLSIDEITQSMERSTQEGGKYFQSMDKQSKTLNGRMSTLKDGFNEFAGKAVKPLSDMLKNNLIPFLTWMLNHSDDIATGLMMMAAAVGAYFAYTTAIKVMQDGWMALAAVQKVVAAGQAVLNTVMAANPIGLIIAAIAGLVAGFIMLWNKSEEFRQFWVGLWNSIKQFVGDSINSIKKFFGGMWDSITKGASNAWNGITSIFGKVADFFKKVFGDAWNGVKNIFSTGGKIFMGIVDGISSAFKSIVNAIIGGINKVVAIPFNAINNVLGKLRRLNILGIKPFKWVGEIFVPKIPMLRQGGVLPKGKTGFLEGDGTEAVVPLEKNKEWIGKVAADMLNALSQTSMVKSLKDSVYSLNKKIADLTQNGDGLTNLANSNVTEIVYNQYNNSPKALSRKEIYRQTKNALNFVR